MSKPDHIQYGSEYDGMARSSSAKAIILMMRADTSPLERHHLSKLVRRYYESHHWVKTPGNDAIHAWMWYQGRVKTWKKAMPTLYPMGLGICHVDLAERASPAVRSHPLIPTRGAMIDSTIRSFKTITGTTSKLAQGVKVEHHFWLPDSTEPDIAFAREYEQECRDLQVTKAGRKAKKLLLENLSPAQADDYIHRGYFFVSPPKKDQKRPRLYAIERNRVCANTLYVEPKRTKSGRIHFYPKERRCLIAKEPHPIDDILLTQKLIIETDEESFLKESNAFNPHHPDRPFEEELNSI